MRFSLSATCLLAVLVSTANARVSLSLPVDYGKKTDVSQPAARDIQDRQLLDISVGISGSEGGQGQSGQVSPKIRVW